MGAGIYFIEDIRNAIMAAEEASESTANAFSVNTSDWRAGYRAALTTLALAFGLSLDIVDGDKSEAGLLTSWRIKEGVEYYE